MIFLLANSCKKNESDEPGNGHLKFCVVDNSQNSLKALNVNEGALSIVFSIDNIDGTNLTSSQKIPLQKFNNIFVTEPIALKAGSYKLTYYAVVDTLNEIKYLTPLSGTSLATMVQHPLSINFDITKDQVCTLVPEVISTNSFTPGDFGLANYSFLIYKPVQVFVYSYNSENKNYEITTSSLTISNGTADILSISLQEKGNIISIPLNEESYTFTITKQLYKTYNNTFTKTEIEALNKPLLIKLEQN